MLIDYLIVHDQQVVVYVNIDPDAVKGISITIISPSSVMLLSRQSYYNSYLLNQGGCPHVCNA